MILFFSGNAGVIKIEPENFLDGRGNIMLTFHEIQAKSSQRRRFQSIKKHRKKKKK